MHTCLQRRLASFLPALVLAALGLPGGSALAQQHYPSKPIYLVVGFPPGGAVDATARLISPGLSEALGQPVIVETRPGAAGFIATDYVAKSDPDGYTILLTTVGHAIAPSIQRKLPFDVAKDFAPVTQIVASAIVLAVNPAKVPVKSLPEFIALAKSKPGALNYASAGSGDPLGLAMELLKQSAGIDVAAIQYKGVGPMNLALLAGEVDAAMMPLGVVLPYAQKGTLRLLAVTGSQRLASMPDLPTVAESGFPGFDITNWQGLFVAAKTPPAIVAAIQQASVKVLATPEVSGQMPARGQEPVGSTPAEFGTKVTADMKTFAKVIKTAGIPMQD
jgi:tripartite-type tricarboxylate transporter receptor subunit TctC